MPTLIVSPRARPATILAPQPPAVYVAGRRRRDLKVLTWEVLGPPTLGRIVLVLHDGLAPTEPPRMERIGDLPPVGALVSVRPVESAQAMEFQGVVTAHRVELGEDGEQLVADVAHRLCLALSAAITSRWHLVSGAAIEVAKVPVCFNGATGDGLASDATAELGDRTTRLFDAATSARRWTVADALAYLIATGAPEEVAAPPREEIEALAGAIDLGELEVTGLTPAQALARVGGRAGLELRAARSGVGLEFYRPCAPGRGASVSLQPAGEALSLSRTNLWKGRMVLHRRPSRRGVLALGAPKRYESTFPLSPGWDASLQTSRWRDFVRSQSPNWQGLADVYRKWVLNEHGWYSDAPWNLEAYDFSDLDVPDFPLLRPRRLLSCLSCNPSGASLGVVVEVRCGADAPWQRWRGPLWVSQTEAAIYLGGDGLPGEFFQAATADEAAVRATAAVDADLRLTAEVEGDPFQARIVVEAAHLAFWSQVLPGSIFHEGEGLGTPDEHDDTAALAELAQRHAEVVSAATQAELTLGRVDLSCSVGDVVDRIEGRGVELRSNPESYPFVRSVRHDFGPGQCTTVFLEG